jgi:hypothetical protein
MTVTVSPVFLLNVAAGAPEAADLLDAITEKQLADWEAEWVPALLEAVQRLHRAGVQRAQWPQSRHWNWRQKAAVLQGLLGAPGFSVVCGGLTQGMMLTDTVTKHCRISSQAGKNLVYVSFVENAPWNRQELFDPPRYRGVGSTLMRAAVELSKEHEFKGRLGLHSLPQANSFYANTCGMTDLGLDADPQHTGLRYFEMTPEQAEAFIEKGGKA